MTLPVSVFIQGSLRLRAEGGQGHGRQDRHDRRGGGAGQPGGGGRSWCTGRCRRRGLQRHPREHAPTADHCQSAAGVGGALPDSCRAGQLVGGGQPGAGPFVPAGPVGRPALAAGAALRRRGGLSRDFWSRPGNGPAPARPSGGAPAPRTVPGSVRPASPGAGPGPRPAARGPTPAPRR